MLPRPAAIFFSNIYSTTPPDRDVLFAEDFEAGGDAWETGYRFEAWSIVYSDDFVSNVIQDSIADYHENEESYIQTRLAHCRRKLPGPPYPVQNPVSSRNRPRFFFTWKARRTVRIFPSISR